MKTYLHAVKGLDPVADAFSGTVYSDVVNASKHRGVTFVIHKGVGASGTSTITVEACDDAVPTNTQAIAFQYQSILSGDTHSEITEATTSGFTTTAGSSQIYLVHVNTQALATLGYSYLRLASVEVVDDPVLGGIAVLMREPSYDKPVQSSVLT